MKSMFCSIKGLGWELGVRSSVLERLGARAVHHYHPFLKSRPGKKPRCIANPDKELKSVQRLIDMRLLKGVSLPDHLHGGVRGRSARTNAGVHLGQKVLVRIDLEDFFPSVTPRQIYALWTKLGYGPPVSSLLTSLTTYRGCLPQGAPTSTALANLVLLEADDEISRSVLELHCAFTRYVDDIGLSGDRPQDLISDAVRTLRKAGFKISRSKIEIMPNSGPQEITGLNVNGKRPSVPRYKRDAVRAAIHRLQMIAGEAAFREEVRSLKGRIQQIALTNKGSAVVLEKQLERVLEQRDA